MTRLRIIPAVWLLLASLLAACAGAANSPSATSEPVSSSAESPEPIATESDDPSASDAPGGSSDVGQPPPPPDFAIGDWVSTTVEGLRLRESPGTGGTELGMLRSGFQGTVIDGPVEADGFEWVHIAWPGLPSGSGCATGPDEDGFLSFCGASGWLATSDPLGNPWVERTEPDCPDRPTTVREMAETPPGLRLACFGGQELSLVGYLAPRASGRGCDTAYDIEPSWLGPCTVSFVQGVESEFDATQWELDVTVHPDLGRCDFGFSPDSCPFVPHVGRWVALTGLVDHPEAESCEVRPHAGNEFYPDDAEGVYRCRERFVVTDIARASAP